MSLEIKSGCSASMPRVAILPWPSLENCYLVLSGAKRLENLAGGYFLKSAKHDEPKFKRSDHLLREYSEPRISFTYEKNGIAAEWDGDCGAITVWKKSEENCNEGEYDKATPHWLWPWATGRGNWTQLGVCDNNLPDAFVTGEYEHIFNVLKSFVESRSSMEG